MNEVSTVFLDLHRPLAPEFLLAISPFFRMPLALVEQPLYVSEKPPHDGHCNREWNEGENGADDCLSEQRAARHFHGPSADDDGCEDLGSRFSLYSAEPRVPCADRGDRLTIDYNFLVKPIVSLEEVGGKRAKVSLDVAILVRVQLLDGCDAEVRRTVAGRLELRRCKIRGGLSPHGGIDQLRRKFIDVRVAEQPDRSPWRLYVRRRQRVPPGA